MAADRPGPQPGRRVGSSAGCQARCPAGTFAGGEAQAILGPVGHWLAAQGLSPSQQVAREEQILALAEAIAALPAAQRLVVEAHYFRGQTVAEIAQAMDKTQAAVAGLLKRALKQLRAIVSPQE